MSGNRHAVGRYRDDRRRELITCEGDSDGGDVQLVIALDIHGAKRSTRLEHRALPPYVELVATVAGVNLEGTVRESNRQRPVAARLAGQAHGRHLSGAGDLHDEERELRRVDRELGEQLNRAAQALLSRRPGESAPPTQTVSSYGCSSASTETSAPPR